jgi:putative endopeptidase
VLFSRFPNKWRDYSTFNIAPDDSFLEMVFKARAFDFKLKVEEMNAPTDREKWVSRCLVINNHTQILSDTILY